MRPSAGARSVADMMPSTPHKLAAAALTTAAAAGGALAVSGAHGVPTASAVDAPITMTFTEPFVGGGGQNKYVDLGRKGMSAGDIILHTSQPAIDAHTGRRVGSSDGVETILSLKHPGTVAVADTVRLPHGHIQVAGTVRHTDRSPALAVIGGTGAYANARGQVTVSEDTKHKRNLITITLLP
jgi:hypothetical protein